MSMFTSERSSNQITEPIKNFHTILEILDFFLSNYMVKIRYKNVTEQNGAAAQTTFWYLAWIIVQSSIVQYSAM